MKKRRSVIICVITVLLLSAWVIRYISLNDGLKVGYKYDRAIYETGEVVAFGDNMSSGINYYDDYSISVDECRIYDSNEYILMLGKTEDDFNLDIPDKILEVTVTLYNDGEVREDDTYTDEDGVYFSSLQVVGTDWYEYFNREFTAYANEIFQDDVWGSYGIIVVPQSAYTFKIIYNLDQRERTDAVWNKIDETEMYLEVTLYPVNQLIKINP